MLVLFARWFYLVWAFFVSRIFRQPNFDFCGFSDLPRAPAPLCNHGLLRQRVNERTATRCFTPVPTMAFVPPWGVSGSLSQLQIGKKIIIQ